MGSCAYSEREMEMKLLWQGHSKWGWECEDKGKRAGANRAKLSAKEWALRCNKGLNESVGEVDPLPSVWQQSEHWAVLSAERHWRKWGHAWTRGA